MEERLLEVLKKYYDELKEIPKPNASKIGGTYYGSTQLFSSVGNHLDFVENGNHTSYGYGGCNTNYQNAFYLRIGGAYKFSTSKIVNELIEILDGKRYINETKLGIIDDYGTNYSVVGFGYIIH